MIDSHQALFQKLEPEIEDPEEETFILYSQPLPSQNLGFIDAKASSLQVQVGEREYTICQSPAILQSARAEGTTGAVLWKITPLFSEWISAEDNILFTAGCLTSSSSIIELGCGISPLHALALSSRVASYTLTDQTYVQKLVLQNIEENSHLLTPSHRGGSIAKRAASVKTSKGRKRVHTKADDREIGLDSQSEIRKAVCDIKFVSLDWEKDDVASMLGGGYGGSHDAGSTQNGGQDGYDAVLACDCVFNYALVKPFVQTCMEVCKLRRPATEAGVRRPSLCIIAQQLRNHEVFQSWLTEFSTYFRVYRVPDEMLPALLRSTAGFVVHIGILRGED